MLFLTPESVGDLGLPVVAQTDGAAVGLDQREQITFEEPENHPITGETEQTQEITSATIAQHPVVGPVNGATGLSETPSL